MGWFRDIDKKRRRVMGFFDCVSLDTTRYLKKKLNFTFPGTGTTHTFSMLNWIKEYTQKNKLFLKRQFKSRLLIFICKSTKYHNIFHISKVYTQNSIHTTCHPIKYRYSISIYTILGTDWIILIFLIRCRDTETVDTQGIFNIVYMSWVFYI